MVIIGDSAVTALAGMFQAFLQYQRDRDERQEKESVRLEREYKVLTHQVTQLHRYRWIWSRTDKELLPRNGQ